MLFPLTHIPGFTTNVRRTQQLAIAVFPHGGQGHARRNAWAGMVSDASISRNRREADAAIVVANRQARQRAERQAQRAL